MKIYLVKNISEVFFILLNIDYFFYYHEFRSHNFSRDLSIKS